MERVSNKSANTVTSKRARYQTLLRCLQSTASCCLSLMIFLVHRPQKLDSIELIRNRIISLRSDAESYNTFYVNLLKAFHQTNVPQLIELLVATNIQLSCLEDHVCLPDIDGTYMKEPIYVLYMFLLRICDERPILVLTQDDARGTHSSYLQEALEHFVSEQIHLRKLEFVPPSEN